MAREYAQVHGIYLPMHELQPSPQHYHHFGLHQASESASPAYELTVGGGVCADASALVAHLPPPAHAPQHDMRKKKTTHYNSDSFEMTSCDSSLRSQQAPPQDVPAKEARKRKSSSFCSGPASSFDDDGEDGSSTRTHPDKKQNHSEIEKRRRDKMNTYISELSAMVPMCGAMSRKLDKLTVLRMAVQHLRSVRGALSACPLTARPRPAFLSERELNALILHAAHDCFLLVVGCDRGRLLFVSTSVKKMLQYEQSDLLGQSLFDILHPKDVAKVKEQLSSSDLSPRERLIDAKTMLPVKAEVVSGASRLCPGARRSFFCRIKCKQPPEPPAPPVVKQEGEPSAKLRKKQTNEKKYCVVQCTGYLKSWAPAEVCEGASSGDEGEACNLSCLVALGRALPDLAAPRPARPAPPPTRHLQYVSRHALDGKFLFVDQRVTLALGFLPQELLGTSVYEYMSGPELGAVARAHKTALVRKEALHTPPYLFRRKDGKLATVQTHFKPFKNPWTKDVDCLVANNTIIADGQALAHAEGAHVPFELYKQTEEDACLAGLGGAEGADDADDSDEAGGDVAPSVSEADIEMQRLIESQVESHKIGSAIAEEALRRSPAGLSPDLPADLLQDAVFNQQASLVDESLVEGSVAGALAGFGQVRNNVPLSAAAAGSPPPAGAAAPPADSPPASPPLPPLGLDGNGEAAMAVIMSLLEADAGLGGPVNFSGLPWPLP